MIACADCGSAQVVPRLPPRGVAECHRCGRQLGGGPGRGIDPPLALSLGVLLLAVPAANLPFFRLDIREALRGESELLWSVSDLYWGDWLLLSIGFLLAALALPVLRSLLLVLVLGALRLGRQGGAPQWTGRVFRWAEDLRPWAMPEVLVAAAAITYARTQLFGEVRIEIGAWCYLAFSVVAVAADRLLDRRAVWRRLTPPGCPGEEDPASAGGEAGVPCDACELLLPSSFSGEPCPRCDQTVHRRRADRFGLSAALVLAGFILIVPGYAYPMSWDLLPDGIREHTVASVIAQLFDHGSWHFGLVITGLGFVLPISLLTALAGLLAAVRHPTRRRLRDRTRAYRILHEAGRWPLTLPFVAALSAPLVDFTGIADSHVGPGATPFFLAMVAGILAVLLFDPRLMWDAAERLPASGAGAEEAA